MQLLPHVLGVGGPYKARWRSKAAVIAVEVCSRRCGGGRARWSWRGQGAATPASVRGAAEVNGVIGVKQFDGGLDMHLAFDLGMALLFVPLLEPIATWIERVAKRWKAHP